MADAKEDRRLSKRQLADLADAVTGAGLRVSDLSLHDVIGKYDCLVHEFRHEDSRAHFRFDWSIGYGSDGPALHWWPAFSDSRHWDIKSSWLDNRTVFAAWCRLVRLEIDTPDVWQIAAHERAWLTSGPESFQANAPFSPLEQETIGRHLAALEQFARQSYHLQQEQDLFLRAQMLYLTEAASRVGRFDWKNLAASTIMNVVLTLGLDPKKAGEFFGFATQLLGPLVTGLRHLLPS